MNQTPVDRSAIAELRRRGLSVCQIGKMVNLSRQRVYQQLKVLGMADRIQTRMPAGGILPIPDGAPIMAANPPAETLLKLHAAGMTAKQISAELDLTISKTYRLLHAAGVPVRARRNNKPRRPRTETKPRPRRARSVCTVPGCGEFVKGNGLCMKHYMRRRYHLRRGNGTEK